MRPYKLALLMCRIVDFIRHPQELHNKCREILLLGFDCYSLIQSDIFLYSN
jgi:hypothetical protein